MNSNRCIMHADMDAFYASIEQKDNPSLAEKPVLVGGRPQERGVVASCSYEARRYGIRSAMPMTTALQKCPDAIIISPRFERYKEISREISVILGSITQWIQPIALDEAFLDITDVVSAGSSPLTIAKKIKNQVKEKTGLYISIGIGTSKSISKIASAIGKPNGLVIVAPGQESEFLGPLPVHYLTGQLASKSTEWGTQMLGKKGANFILMSRGTDTDPVSSNDPTKSISMERTFAQDISDPNQLYIQLSDLCINLAMKLDRAGLKGRTISLKLRLGDFKTFTRSKTLPSPLWQPTKMYAAATALLRQEIKNNRSFRLIGVSVSNFTFGQQFKLFS